MGQYFMPTLLGENYEIEATLYSFDYGQRLKLMEHSYIGNPLVCAVAMLIKDEPKRVAWIGDYAKPDILEGKGKTITRTQFTKIQKNRYSKAAKRVEPVSGGMRTGYLINYTKMEFVDLERYVQRQGAKDHIPNPLPLLTVVSDVDCGDWAFDLIQFWPEANQETLRGFTENKFPVSKKCDVCGESFKGYGHGPYPLPGKTCCDKCNYTKVVPAREELRKQAQK